MPDELAAIGRILQRRALLDWTQDAFAVLHAGACIALGAALVGGGYPRMTGPSFALVRAVPDAPTVWGGGITAAGLLIAVSLLCRSHTARLAGFLTAAIWYLFFAITLGAATITEPCPRGGPCPAVTGIVTYLLLAALTIVHAGLALTIRREQ